MEIKEILKEFLESNDILIVDSSSSARVSLAGTLATLGAKRNRMSLIGTMDEARSEISRIKPKLIFVDYMVGKESGLDLLQEQKRDVPSAPKDTLFVLVTSNGSQSTVARAAEEDVDTFVIKPYTLQSFTKSVGEALLAKLKPSNYAQLIEKGKIDLAAGELDQAMTRFTEAKKLQPSPTLACFYLGQTEMIKKALEDAAGSYREGLSHNKVHYKCMVGLFDLLMTKKEFDAAYDVVKRLSKYFPANPKRLSSVLRLAIMTNNFSDIEGYYQLFVQIDARTDELVRYVCSALAITGKYYLSNNTRSRGLELFDKIAASCAGRIQFMRYAVETMVKYDCGREAEDYLKRFPAEMRGQVEYHISALLVAGARRPSGEVLKLGRELIEKGVEHPTIYEVLIHHSMKAGLKDSAEHLAENAKKKWPKQAELFVMALQTEKNEKKAA